MILNLFLHDKTSIQETVTIAIDTLHCKQKVNGTQRRAKLISCIVAAAIMKKGGPIKHTIGQIIFEDKFFFADFVDNL